MADGPTKTRVAVLGGGVGGVVTAFWLTSTPELRAQYDVTIYQMGWRLGGKGASGRNAALGDRIEEHGLHIWFGFYDNAFLTMRNCYEELVATRPRAESCPIRDFDGAFTPSPAIGLFEQWDEEWIPHEFDTPDIPPPLRPELGRSGVTPSLWHIVANGIEWAMDAWDALCAAPGARAYDFPKLPVHRFLHWSEHFDIDLNQFHSGAKEALLERIKGLLLREEKHPGVHEMSHVLGELVIAPLVKFKDELWEHVISQHLDHPGFRLFFTTFDTFLSAVTGVIAENVPANGYLSIDDQELSDFLRKYGANEFTLVLEQSPFLHGWYDAAFAFTYVNGKLERNLAAGTGIHGIFGVIGRYHRHIAFKMEAGMGDTVFGPFYEVLKDRDVHFEFFSEVTALELSDDRAGVERIHVRRQVGVHAGPDAYEPLVDVKGLPCWPSEPRWEQLDIATEHRGTINFEYSQSAPGATDVVLTRSTDFDTVVLAIPAPALGTICGEISAHVPEFKAMLDNCRSTMTQAAQVWTTSALGHLGARFRKPAIATAFAEPIDTYCDMSHLLERENWLEPGPVGVAYFCGVMPDQPTQADAGAEVERAVFTHLEDHAVDLWPDAVRPDGSFDWSVLYAPGIDGPGKEHERLAAQYLRANHAPTERYVLSTAGSTRYRLPGDALVTAARAGFPGVDNLYLAGDWTRNGINGGCVEAATMSGMQTARAICGTPAVIADETLTWAVKRTPATGPTFHEYVGLTSVPGPFDCTDATIYAFALEADPEKLEALCETLLVDEVHGRSYRPLGHFAVLTFGVMTVRSLSQETSSLFDMPYDEMGASVEHHAALWVPLAVSHRTGHARVIDQISMFLPAMWVDNPISLLGGREIYGIAKQWGFPTITDGHQPSCSLDVYGGSFGRHATAGRTRLFDLVPRADGAPAPATLVPPTGDVPRRGHDGFLHRMLQGHVILPSVSLLREVVTSLAGHHLHQVSARQFRTPEGNGAVGTGVDLVESLSTFRNLEITLLHHTSDFTLQSVASHPLFRTLGLRDQPVHFGVEITGDFTLQAD